MSEERTQGGTDPARLVNCCMILLIGPFVVVVLVITHAVLFALSDPGGVPDEPRTYVPPVNTAPVATAPVEDVTAPVEDIEAPVEGIEAPVKDITAPVVDAP
ncbi:MULTISPECIES: hypothetical protein [unclassified Nocardiopsis]|uniref:hypothetical protein n=1 Tax=Nocardiopsis TaxID=2013 RepID=UPI00387AAE4C